MSVKVYEIETLRILAQKGHRLRMHRHIPNYVLILKDLVGTNYSPVAMAVFNNLKNCQYIKYYEGVSHEDYIISKKGRELLKEKGHGTNP